MRGFVAVEITSPIRDALAKLIADLRRHETQIKVKWVAPENIHLTLKFLGSVSDEALPRVLEVFRESVQGIDAFELEAEGIGGFPNLQRPRVLFAGANDNAGGGAGARELARRLNDGMTSAGVPRENRPFRYHITLGRVRRPGPMREMAQRLEQLSEHSFGTIRVNRIVLMESRLTPAGPVYTPVEYAPLGTDVAEASSQ